MKDRKVQGEKDCHNGQNEKCFVMNGWQKSFGNKHKNDNEEKSLGIEPIQIPAKKHRHADKNGRENKKNFFGIKI